MSEFPTRELRDPSALRAFTHPARLKLLEELVLIGPATATELSERVGESPANCSWHLRQLARFGFVEEAGGGAGRQRPWQVVVQSHTWGEGEETPELAAAGDAAAEVLFQREADALRAYFAARRREPPEWRDAAFSAQSILWLTAAELAEVQEALHHTLARFFDRIGDPAQRPAGARAIRLVAWGVPARPLAPTPTEEPDA